MKHTWNISKHKRSCNTRFLVIALFLSIMTIQASMACGFVSQAHLPRTLAASHEYYDHLICVNPFPPNNGISASPAPATAGIVVINEVLPFPQSQWNCTAPANASSSRDLIWVEDNVWVEIYNPQNQPLDLYADHACIDQGSDSTNCYYFPFGSIIPAYGFLVLFPFQYISMTNYPQLPLLRLIIDQVIIDQVSIPSSLLPDTSYARIPDGSNNWQITTTPTIGSSNLGPTVTAQTGNATSTPTHTTKQTPTSKHSVITGNDGAGTETSSTGVQPTWSALRLPSSASNPVTPQQNNSALSAASSTTSTDPFDLIKKILFTLFIVICCSALLWGWRLYKKRSATKPHASS